MINFGSVTAGADQVRLIAQAMTKAGTTDGSAVNTALSSLDYVGAQTEYKVSGRGTVYSYTVNYRGEGAYRDRGPYVLAYVELDEGPRMMTNIVDAGDTGVAVGMPVEVVFHDTGEGSATPSS